ncbi:transcriptional regulator [Corynebacterium maris DSM 45190]|uniref:Transcriptional regulator n=2 Tax=Corynebacterium TaxID=1716 RepID=S5TKY6_9CORY|nr:transcriptional regulator [Corynebacterium maris DSM 45190]
MNASFDSNDSSNHQHETDDEERNLKSILARQLGVEDGNGSLAGRIAIDVGMRIIQGELLPGSDLNSVDLASDFNSSRTPVREALLMLEKQGLVEVPARRRPVVKDYLNVRVDKIYETRALLTGYMSMSICLNWVGDDLDKLWQHVEEMQAASSAGDVNRFFWANVHFGEDATRIADNQFVAETVDSLGLTSLGLRRRSMALPGRMEASTRDHVRLHEAFRARDTSLARALSMGIIRDAYFALSGGKASRWPFD